MKVEEVGERSQEEVLDQSVYANINAEWVNRKGESDARMGQSCSLSDGFFHVDVHAFPLSTGAWVIHPLLIVTGKVVSDAIPGMTQEISWTFVNLAYLFVRRSCVAYPSKLMAHITYYSFHI